MADPPLALIEFPADDADRARRFWSGLLDVALEPRGPGDSFSLPYFEVDDLEAALERVQALGGTVIHPGERWAICRDSEGSPFGLAVRGG